MRNVNNYFMAMIVGMSCMVLYSAQPINKDALVESIRKDFKEIQETLTQLVSFSPAQMTNALRAFDDKNLHLVSDVTSDFNERMVGMLEFVKKHAAAGKPVPSKVPVAGISTATGYAHHVLPPQANAGAKKPVTSNVSEDYSMGTATGNLMVSSPKFKLSFKIGAEAKKLAELSADQKKLHQYASPKRKVTLQEEILLRKFENASQGKLKSFIEYVKALIEGNNVPAYFKKLHISSVTGNTYEATEQMQLEDLNELLNLLQRLPK